MVAEAADGAEAIKCALAQDIHLAILDISMPRMTGLQAARELSHRRPQLRLLMLSMYDNEQFLFEALKAGASGYVLKSGADDDCPAACRFPRGGPRRPGTRGRDKSSLCRPLPAPMAPSA